MKKIVLVVCVCLIFGQFGFAQTLLNKDSLLRVLRSATVDTQKVKIYYQLATFYFNEDLKEAERFCKTGGALSRKINYRQGVLDYYTYYSNILAYHGQFEANLKLNLEAVEYAKMHADSTDIARTLLNAGIAYARMHDYESAVLVVEKGRDVLIRNGIHQFDGFFLGLLQWLYVSMHQYRKAVDSGIQSIDILEQSQNRSQLQEAYNNIGLGYIFLYKTDSARFYLNKATEIANQTGESMIHITTNLNHALLALREQQIDSIKLYAERALQLARKYDANEYKALGLYGMAYYYLLKREYNNSRLTADSALALANQYNHRETRQKLYALLSSLYYAMQDGKRGYYYFNKYEQLSDSILNGSIANSTVAIEKKYETERMETQIKLQQSQIKQKTIQNYLLLSGALALVIIGLLVFRNYNNRQKLQQVKIDELETEKQLTATEAVLKGEEQERTRLAKDLHDGLGGMLSGIKYSLNTMKGNLIMTQENSQAFERSIDMLDSSIKEMRRVAHNMMPEVLVKYGLDVALKDFCAEIDRSGVVHLRYQSININAAVIEQTIAVTIYRIVQELVNNAIKHASAKNVLVQAHLFEEEKLLSITVEDDGVGFDPILIKEGLGMGWKNIQNRIEFLKGKLDVQSSPDNGTSVMIETPI